MELKFSLDNIYNLENIDIAFGCYNSYNNRIATLIII